MTLQWYFAGFFVTGCFTLFPLPLANGASGGHMSAAGSHEHVQRDERSRYSNPFWGPSSRYIASIYNSNYVYTPTPEQLTKARQQVEIYLIAVEKRRKRLSKEKYGTSHIVSKEEAKFVFEDGCEVLIVGAGQDGNVRLSPEASTYFDKKRCRVILQPTPEAIVSFNRSRDKKIALIHVTC